MPIILVSAQASENIRIKARNVGANYTMAKPLKLKILMDRVQQLIGKPTQELKMYVKGEMQLKSDFNGIKRFDSQNISYH